MTKGFVAQGKNTKLRPLLRVTAFTSDISSGVVDVAWQNVENEGNTHEPRRPSTESRPNGSRPGVQLLTFSKVAWRPSSIYVAQGKASRFSHNTAYTIFANNLVDYGPKHRGMQSAVIHELEGSYNKAGLHLQREGQSDWQLAVSS
ncbi:hypothetical protein DM02DRAFT_684837 [Periconia macrospinosa]|uniref:Uncharacterized protein n=1 Tax=Periconia macrospinosa TaxID=97972 RepID=A0A2V1DK70_9PLEO|nr:hypothetical protein DM02DRAFT_684837 [Periconia macrospinosa]